MPERIDFASKIQMKTQKSTINKMSLIIPLGLGVGHMFIIDQTMYGSGVVCWWTTQSGTNRETD